MILKLYFLLNMEDGSKNCLKYAIKLKINSSTSAFLLISLSLHHFHYLSRSMSPSNTILFPFPLSYPIQLDDDARLALLVSIVTVVEPRAVLQDGAVELTGALWVVLHISAVLLQEVLIRGALVIFLGLD